MPAIPHPDGLHQPGIDPRQVRPFGDRLFRHLEEVQHLADGQPVAPACDLDDDDGPFIPVLSRLLEENVTVEHGEEGSPNVDQPFDRLGHARYPGGREARQDLPHDPCRGRANKRTDAKNDGVERGRVSHLY